MADKKETSNERVYTIPLKRKVKKTAIYKRTPKAIKTIKEFLKKHMKSNEVKLSKELNETIWSRGIKHPPSKIKVKAIKNETGAVIVSVEK